MQSPHSIIEYPESENNHKDIKSNLQEYVPYSVVQMLHENCQALHCDHFLGRLFWCPTALQVKNLLLVSNPNLPWNRFWMKLYIAPVLVDALSEYLKMYSVKHVM